MKIEKVFLAIITIKLWYMPVLNWDLRVRAEDEISFKHITFT